MTYYDSIVDKNGVITYVIPKIYHTTDVESNTTLYSDRLFQWDSKKYNKFSKKHFGNEGQYFSGRSSEKIEAFLKDYIGNKNLTLCYIEELENVATGYPYWRFEVNIPK